MPMTPEERNAFRISLSGKPEKELKNIFNRLTKDRENENLSDYKRGIAGEKAAMVQRAITQRKHGAFEG